MFLFSSRGLITPKAALDNSVSSSTTTFDPSNTSINVVLSSGNLVATGNGSAGSTDNSRTITHHTEGKYYAEFTLTTFASDNVNIGFVNSTFPIGSIAVGGDTNSIGWYKTGPLYSNNTTVANFSAYSQGTVIGIAIDCSANLAWWTIQGGFAGNPLLIWNNLPIAVADPVAGIGGIDLSGITGDKYAAVQIHAPGNSWTGNFGGSMYILTVPSGFGNF